jgi:hypothetical protein
MRHTDIATNDGSHWWAVLDSGAMPPTYNARAICGSMSAASAHSEESDTPMRRTPFRSGDWAASNSALIDAKAERSEIGVTRDRLRVMIWKSANFTLSVTVCPLTPVVSQ